MTTGQTSNLKIPDNMWLIHGKLYDFESFVSQHPGGENFIRAGQGKDITEVFESVHVLSNKDMNKFIKNYQVETPDNLHFEDYFTWKEDGFYSVLSKKLKEKYNGRNYKSTYVSIFKAMVAAIFAIVSLFLMITTGSVYHAFLYGVFFTSLGFTAMHEASHGGISHKPWINEYISVAWNSWCFWNHWIWLHHHCIYHHSYTSIYEKDPDVAHWWPFIRKSEDQPQTELMKNQTFWVWLINIFPGQFLGQLTLYKRAEYFPSYKIFGLEYGPQPDGIRKAANVIGFFAFLIQIVLPFYFLHYLRALLCLFVMFFSLGFWYWACVAPNHDTEESLENLNGTIAKNMDWGELQVRSSGNHSTTDSFLDNVITSCWGGMNFQIEHHLFPSISHVHYPEIAVIVKETCKEFQIPYNSNQTWIGALVSYFGFLKKLETL